MALTEAQGRAGVLAACTLVVATVPSRMNESDHRAIGVLPGAPPLAAELRERLARAAAVQARSGKPRTRHLEQDGSPRYTNRLILESSPYLQQHAHNPVNWYPWGDEAFADARRLGWPILLSIGYSTCHWCHVMEEESFEDLEIAAYLNANYIPIKVDREERPDLDSIYMTAVQLLSGHGGWPMTTWLTPAGQPFFGGTYYPARDGDRGASTGFLSLLRSLKQVYDEDPDRVRERAAALAEGIQLSLKAPRAGEIAGAAAIDSAIQSYKARFDPRYGGLGGSPKFPSSLPLRLLLRQYARTGDKGCLEMAVQTLDRMAAGGIYDHVAGGFHRYSTDAGWLVPHFEKMLYDNALLAVAYLEAYQVTGSDSFARVAGEVLRYVSREMTAPEGAFYSASDADSLGPGGERVEGWYYTWTPAELERHLGAEEAKRFASSYGVTAAGNFEGRSILHATQTLDEPARATGLAAAREKLYAARSSRPAPLRDEKILTSWNGLMISAQARGGFILKEPALLRNAERAAEFVLVHLRGEDGRLLRSYKDGRARHKAYLDDYAFLIGGLLDLYEAGAEPRWLEAALALQTLLDRHYADVAGGYFMTGDDHEPLLAREKPFHDGAEPSGNSVALLNLLRLHELTGDDRYRAGAAALLRAFGVVVSQQPTSVAEMLVALDFHLGRPKQVVIVAAGEPSAAEPFLVVLRRTFLPGKVQVVVSEGAALARLARVVPLVEGKLAQGGRTTAYVCEQGTCKLPTTDVETFRRQLEGASSAGASTGAPGLMVTRPLVMPGRNGEGESSRDP